VQLGDTVFCPMLFVHPESFVFQGVPLVEPTPKTELDEDRLPAEQFSVRGKTGLWRHLPVRRDGEAQLAGVAKPGLAFQGILSRPVHVVDEELLLPLLPQEDGKDNSFAAVTVLVVWGLCHSLMIHSVPILFKGFYKYSVTKNHLTLYNDKTARLSV